MRIPAHLDDKIHGTSWREIFSWDRVYESWGRLYGEDIHESHIDDLHDACAEGAVAVDRITLPAFPDAAIDLKQFSGNTQAHRNLCAIAATWLAALGDEWTSSPKKLQYPGGRSDVAVVDKTMFVECGYTQSKKVMAGLRGGVAVVVVPYPRGSSVQAFVFRLAGEMPPDRYEAEAIKAIHAVKWKPLDLDNPSGRKK